MRKDIPPKDVTIKPSGYHEDGRGQATFDKFLHPFANRPAISVVESDCNSRTAVPRLVDSVEWRHIGERSQHIELCGEFCLRDE
jgi:hypothetical protein